MKRQPASSISPAAAPPPVLRVPASVRWTLAACLAMLLLLGAAILAALPPLNSLPGAAAFALLAGLAVGVALAWLIAAECVAAFHLRIELKAQSVSLRLPARRGHVLRRALADDIPYAAIDRVESRDEAFRTLGLVAIQTVYRLVLKDGSGTEVGADRQLRAPLFGPAARAIAERCGQTVRHAGMVDAAPGLLAAFGTSAPAWNAPTLPAATARRRIDEAARASRNLGIFVVIVTILRLVLRR
jgi:hypothetical protein